MVSFEKTKLEGVLLIKPEKFEDHRGEYTAIYNEKLYTENIKKINNVDIKFVEDDISVTMKHCLKGIHGDDRTYKLINCLYGKFYLVVVNNDQNSHEYGKWESFVLSDKNRWQVFVPNGFGNGHIALSDISIFGYKQSEYYDPSHQFTIRYDDPRFNIWWPVKNPILSQRDEAGHFV